MAACDDEAELKLPFEPHVDIEGIDTVLIAVDTDTPWKGFNGDGRFEALCIEALADGGADFEVYCAAFVTARGSDGVTDGSGGMDAARAAAHHFNTGFCTSPQCGVSQRSEGIPHEHHHAGFDKK